MSLEDSFQRIEEYSRRLALPFRRTQAFSRAVLLPADAFEEVCVREGEPQEAALFQTSAAMPSAGTASARERSGQSSAGTRGLGLRRKTVNPLASVAQDAKYGNDVEWQLQAAQKLLEA
jgi:hypothetical protein